jgi:hypothetical protein
LRTLARLFDLLVGAQQDRFWDREAQRLRSFEVDDQLKLNRILDWQIGWVGAFEDAIDVPCRLVEQSGEINPIRDQAA